MGFLTGLWAVPWNLQRINPIPIAHNGAEDYEDEALVPAVIPKHLPF